MLLPSRQRRLNLAQTPVSVEVQPSLTRRGNIRAPLKDRKMNQGPNMPWGQGDTAISEILQLMKKEKYSFPACIELEYPVPEGSSALAELAKCVQYCKDALA
jgi:hypothetical protein